MNAGSVAQWTSQSACPEAVFGSGSGGGGGGGSGGAGGFGYCLQDSGQLEIQHSSGATTWASGHVGCEPSVRKQLPSRSIRSVSCLVDLDELLSADCALKVGACQHALRPGA